MNEFETERLTLRRLRVDDAPFIFELVNDDAFLRYIGDKGVRTLDDAVQYIVNGPVASYARNGFGLLLVSLKTDGTPIGICGLLKRETFPEPDIGFAFLPPFRSSGYAREAAAAVMQEAETRLAIPRVLAITQPDNESSIRLLERLGMRREQPDPPADDHGQAIQLFARTF